MSKRSGGSFTLPYEVEWKRVTHKFLSMEEAVRYFEQGADHYSEVKRRYKVKPWNPGPGFNDRIMGGSPELMDRIMDEADKLIDDAIELDPRLAKKSGFEWSCDDGFDIDPGRFMDGEEYCVLNRKKKTVATQTHTDRCRVVISTDSSSMNPSHVAAAIATIKLAQQFRQIELWWQGAWFRDSSETNGIVFHVPVITGDMDFSRIQFILGDDKRDNVSHRIAMQIQKEERAAFGLHTGERCHLEGYDYFVPESGITSDAWAVSWHASQWAGMTPLYLETVRGTEAQQKWEPVSATPTGTVGYDSAYWDKLRKEEEKKMSLRAQSRGNQVQ